MCIRDRYKQCTLRGSVGWDEPWLRESESASARTFNPVSVSSAKQTLEKLPEPRYFSSLYLGPTCTQPATLTGRMTLHGIHKAIASGRRGLLRGSSSLVEMYILVKKPCTDWLQEPAGELAIRNNRPGRPLWTCAKSGPHHDLSTHTLQ